MYSKSSLTVINKSIGTTLETKRDLLYLNPESLIYVRWINQEGEHISQTIQHIFYDYTEAERREMYSLKKNLEQESEFYTCINTESKEQIKIDLNTLYFMSYGSFSVQL